MYQEALERAQFVAGQGDMEALTNLARSGSTPLGVLDTLAESDDPQVAAIAMNVRIARTLYLIAQEQYTLQSKALQSLGDIEYVTHTLFGTDHPQLVRDLLPIVRDRGAQTPRLSRDRYHHIIRTLDLTRGQRPRSMAA